VPVTQQVIESAKQAAASARQAARNALGRKDVDGAAADLSLDAAIEAAKAAALAEAAFGARDLPQAEAQCCRAQDAAGRALTSSAEAVGAADFKTEWEECRRSIDRFDKILVDLRKTGFSFLTAIIGATAIWLGQASLIPSVTASISGVGGVGKSANILVGVHAVIMLLILALYVVDRSHQVWLHVAVKRAKCCEEHLGFNLTTSISKQLGAGTADRIGFILYLVLLLAASFIFVEGIKPLSRFHELIEILLDPAEQRFWVIISAVACGIFMFLVNGMMRTPHVKKALDCRSGPHPMA
jgi:hypothetical protein